MVEEKSNEEQVTDGMLWAAFWLGVRVRGELRDLELGNTDIVPPSAAEGDELEELKAALRRVRAQISLVEGTSALLRRIAEGEHIPWETSELVSEWADSPDLLHIVREGDRRTQELAQRLVARIDRNEREFRHTLKGRAWRKKRNS